MEIIHKKNKKIFQGRITGNLYKDKKSDIKRRRDSILENECVDGEWVFEQYKKQNGMCANLRCNYRLNNIFEEEEIMGCWRVTSVNRINNSVGHIKSNCNLMHWYCNCNLQHNIWIDTPCYLFKCNVDKCECYENYKKVFEKLNHPENIEYNINRMKEIRKSWRRYEYKRRRKIYFNNKYQLAILENKYWRVMRQLRWKVKQKKELIIKNQQIKNAVKNIVKKLKEKKTKKRALKNLLEKIILQNDKRF
jgi:hypothetical protein